MIEILRNFVLDEGLFSLPGNGEKKRYLIEKNTDWELVLMIWGEESQTPIHDHGGSGCWSRLLKGQLSEKIFFKDTLLLMTQNEISPNEITYVDKDVGVHQLINNSPGMAFTLHLYMKPLMYCNAYDELKKDWKILENHYDHFEGF